MGILANIKEFLARKTDEVAKRVADGIASTSALSPKQMELVAKKRVEYLSQKPDMDGEEVQKVIRNNLGAVGIEVYQAYLEQLKSLYSPIDTAIENFDELNRIRFFDVTKWVIDSEEQNLDKLVNVYQVLSEEDCNIALIYHRTKEKCKVTIGVVNTDMRQADPSKVITFESRLQSAIRGNFPGVEIRCNMGKKDAFGLGVPQNLQQIIKGNAKQTEVQSVAIVSNLASEKSEDFISQSMEKLLDGIIPQNETEEYTIVLLAKPINNQLERKNRLFELYSALVPYASWQTNYTYTQSDAINSSANFGVNLGLSAGIQRSVAVAQGTNQARLYKENEKDGVVKKFAKGVIGSSIEDWFQYAPIQDTNSATETCGYQASANFGVSFARSSNVTVQIGINEGLTQTYANYGIQHTLEIIENQLKRLEESSALGMWEFAAYITSKSPVIANNVAHMYLALTQGDKSYVTRSAVNLWDGEENKEEAQTILKNIQKLQHPVFGLKDTRDDEWLLYPTLVTPSAVLSGKELAKSLNFPRKSVSGLPILQSIAFGREVQKFVDIETDESAKREIIVGQIYHMRHTESCGVNLDVDNLTSHTFITGSTGTGKSNVIYQLLSKLKKNGVKFLVIEPAKGEYKDVLGKEEDVVVYGTNPLLNDIELLKINPFRFPKSVHVLEHMDRIVEIFNVCWPMYAAMPAILKDSIERAYIASGWDLETSENRYSPDLFPSFTDVTNQVKLVLSESDYSDDNKGDYTGSLVTRLKSLTNGINGLILSNDDLTDEELFDKNVIVDLSRVGSSETKSLLMGLLVLKLQEHRMEQRANDSKMNSDLKHVTVLEEAHNLLRRTSTEQSNESSNLLGKSVEMLANSIAEMRTYGEGFVIADQSPSLLDMSVIRNTNTKIIMRLPDYSDRLLVGKSAGLTENQINELSRFKRGVAAITQSDWLEPVLCMIDKYEPDKNTEKRTASVKHNEREKRAKVRNSLLECVMSKEIYRKGDRIDILMLRESVIKSNLDAAIKCDFLEYIDSEGKESIKKLRQLVFDFFDAEKAMNKARRYGDIKEWACAVVEELDPSVKGYSNQQINILLSLLINEKAIRDMEYQDLLNRFTEIFIRERRVF